ncbi:hypothetical protein V7138_21530 [Bacillus sp. JJ1533]|uniref:hypothetical protein n=1 Tax=Bacillus sp. JJ1533 TaxID=3122959 RepID=UPI003000A172
MKKLLLFSLISLFLFGCSSNIHKNISENMARDTEQILSIFDSTIEEDKDLTEKDKEVMLHYQAAYGVDTSKLSEEENRLYLLTEKLIRTPKLFITLESDKDRYQQTKKIIHNVIKTGEIYD